MNFEQKLGHLYEDALEILIRASDRYELVAKNLQVSDASGRTIGEIDFLVGDSRSGIVWHLELAVKFYLAFLDGKGTERYPGPDPRDNWINKLKHLQERQLRLSEQPETRELLEGRFGIRNVMTAQRVYGILFDQIGSSRESRPPAVCRSCRRAKWLYLKQWESFYPSLEAVRIVPKCLWPVEMSDELMGSLVVVPVEELKRQARERCILFCDQASGDVAFLVPDDWPQLSD
ncbi:DUF1853 family protein [Pelagicoccus sp. SDUM812002]|uniref:DUF1853 family protein n=1 Tax=Pelagicoccus sp. SDUM812002 TaxID=3041266 RepID=UPI00280DDE90|nr:DUF1853 family protein [Pelagicoccus sp. SDUM812002]MDQ8185744.1 DUF1853 family protein [Pelagicoccus sp. SDUM812002]